MKEYNSAEQPQPEILRSQTIGIIEVRPDDTRQSVLTAILTQEKLGRGHIVLLLPAENKSFYRKVDFEGLRELQRELQSQIIIVVQPGSKVASYARQQRFPLYPSLGDYAAAVRLQQPALAEAESQPPGEQPQSLPKPASAREAEPPADLETSAGPAPAIPGAEQPAVPSGPRGALPSLLPAVSRRLPPLFTRGNQARWGPLASRRGWLLSGIAIGLLLLASLVVIPLTQLFGGAATAASVTLVPEARPLKQLYTLSGQPGLPANPARHQISARLLASAELRQSRQVPASGHGVRPASRAEGVLTFYNALPVPQSVPKGTVLSDQSGVEVMTDETAQLAAAMPPMEASASVPAHAIQPGSQGNIPAFDFRAVACCGNGITVQNPLAFSGGSDPQPYTYVQQSDIDQASMALQASLIAAAQRDLQSRAAANERFAGQTRCPTLTSTDHQAGDRVPAVTVTVSVICSGEVYDQVEARVLAASLLANDALRHPGPRYSLAGQIATSIVSVSLDGQQQGLISLRVQAEGIWVYRLDSLERQRLASLIKGKTRDEALALLRQQPGIKSASIALSGSGSRLPDDANSITVRVATVSGLQASPLPTVSSVAGTAQPSVVPEPAQPISSSTSTPPATPSPSSTALPAPATPTLP
ncbi:baseplate J/gp47 family protein [Thermogemmatispora sp.]|uniref:baseplate J/gp47 family protein n=1 Tax=Thermogemmatispora sp. TaxID=1968838 RepID=UPI0035E40B5D